MSFTATRPPPPRLAPAKLRNGNKLVYTLHSNPNDVLAWRLEDTRVKIATVAFRRESDAEFMAHVLERHIKREKKWPDMTMVDDSFSIFGGAVIDPTEERELIEVRPWKMDALQIFCVDAFLDMIVLSEVSQGDYKFNLSGEVIKLSTSPEYIMDRLDEIHKLQIFEPELPWIGHDDDD